MVDNLKLNYLKSLIISSLPSIIFNYPKFISMNNLFKECPYCKKKYSFITLPFIVKNIDNEFLLCDNCENELQIIVSKKAKKVWKILFNFGVIIGVIPSLIFLYYFKLSFSEGILYGSIFTSLLLLIALFVLGKNIDLIK